MAEQEDLTGFTAADDVLSDCMVEEGIGPADSRFDVDAETIAASKVRFPARDELFELKATG